MDRATRQQLEEIDSLALELGESLEQTNERTQKEFGKFYAFINQREADYLIRILRGARDRKVAMKGDT
jgi:hypothetical protein